MQLGVGGHGRETRMPDRVGRCSRYSTQFLATMATRSPASSLSLVRSADSEARGAHGKRPVVEDHAPAERGGGEARMALPRTFKP